MTTFGQVIRKRRQELGLTLLDLAKKVGTQKGYLCMIEIGTVNPPSTRITENLAQVLGFAEPELLMLGWAEKAPKKIRDRVIKKLDLWRAFP